MTTEEHTLFGELANALMSWRVDTSGDRKNLWMHGWNIRLLINNNEFDTIVGWLEYHKDPNYAREFENKFQNLYKNVDNFYNKLIQDKLDEKEFREQIQLLEDEAKQLAQHVSNVEYLCLTDKTIMQRIVGNKGVQELEQTRTEQKSKRNRPTKAEMGMRNKAVTMAAVEIQMKYDRLPTVNEIMIETKLSLNQIYATAPYKEGKIAKSSARVATEMTGGSVHENPQFSETSELHSRAKRRSKTEQHELDELIDQQVKDQNSNFVM